MHAELKRFFEMCLKGLILLRFTSMKQLLALILVVLLQLVSSCKEGAKKSEAAPETAAAWETDFLDDFDTFNPDNWQDQRIWVNNETQCYVPDGEFGTREVSDGTLKIKVVNVGQKRPCDNLDKHGTQHPDTEYVAGRICSKNRKEFVKGRWTARLRLSGNGEPSMFPAWWLLGAIGDLHDDWPPTVDDVETLLDELTWYRWDAHEPEMGWNLQLAVEDPAEDVAWAILARDAT